MLAAMPVFIATTTEPIELDVVLVNARDWKCIPHTFSPAMMEAVALLQTMDKCRSSSLAVYAKAGLPSTGGPLSLDCRVTFEAWRRHRGRRTRLPDDHELTGSSLQLPVALAIFLKALQLLTRLVDADSAVVSSFDPFVVATGELKNGAVAPVQDIGAKLDVLQRWRAAVRTKEGPVPLLMPHQDARNVPGVRRVPIGKLHEALEFLLSAWLEANEERIRVAVQPLIKEPAPLLKGPPDWVCAQWSTYGATAYARLVIPAARDRLASQRKIGLGEQHAGRVLRAALDWSGKDVGGRFDASFWRLAALRYVQDSRQPPPVPWDDRVRSEPQPPAGGGIEVLEHVLKGDPSRSELPAILRYLQQKAGAPEREVLAALRAVDRRLDEAAPKDRPRILALAERFAASSSGPVVGAAVAIIERLPVDGSKRWRALRAALRDTPVPGRAQLLAALTRQVSTEAQQRELRKLGRAALRGEPSASVRRAASAALERLTRNGQGSSGTA